MYKNDNNCDNFNKSYGDNLNINHNLRPKLNEVVTIDKIKRYQKYNLNLNEDKVNEYNDDPKKQRKSEIMNY